MKILVINPGSTSTKMAIFDDDKQVWTAGAHHPVGELARFEHVADQYEYRRDFVIGRLEKADIPLRFDAVIGRGGLQHPLRGGVYTVNERMKHDLRHATMEHACNLGALIAAELAERCGCPAYTADPVVVDEMRPEARISGLPCLERRSVFHALNQKAVSRRYAASIGRRYEDLRLIVAHMGGGISVGAHCLGRVIDVNNALGGEGPFTPERCGTLPAMQLVELCYSGKYTLRQMKRMICGKGGLAAWLGSNDMIGLSARAEAGEEPYATVVGAMMYTVAKEIGSMYVALGGKVDAIIVTGGIAHDTYCVDRLRPQVEYMAPVVVMPGENEMLSLAFNALGALRGELELMEYTGDDCREGIVSPVAID